MQDELRSVMVVGGGAGHQNPNFNPNRRYRSSTRRLTVVVAVIWPKVGRNTSLRVREVRRVALVESFGAELDRISLSDSDIAEVAGIVTEVPII